MGSQVLESHTLISATQEVESRSISVQSQPRQTVYGQIVHKTLSWKNSPQKRAGGVAPGVDPEFLPQYRKKKKKKAAWTQALSGDPT
jgi:hypothetical protein